jgi:hypothetical protein
MMRKTLIMAWLLASLIGCAAAKGQLWSNKQSVAKQNYLRALNSKHACIRNSAIFQVMQYQARFPQEDLRSFVQRLRELSVKDASPEIRLYAFLAFTFLENEELLAAAGAPPKSEEEKEAYFERLQKILHGHDLLARQ